LNPEVGSIRASFHKLFPVPIYETEVPEKLAVPSMYVPPPFSFDGADTVSTFLKTYSLSVKLFHQDSQQAYAEAERIADAVRARRMLVPLLNPDGSDTGDYVRIKRIDTRESGSGVALIVLTWDSRYFYEREAVKPLTGIKIESGVKP
jgi:hypothetical protein